MFSPSLSPLRCTRPLLAVTLALAACGGGTPPPKSESDAPAAKAAADEGKATDQDKDTAGSADAAASPSSGSSADTSGAAASSDETKPKAAAPSNGDLTAPPADDPWMAPHQMPPSDVLKTMRASMGKVNACYRAAKKRDGQVSGDVKIKFVITHEGAVRVWRDEESTMSDPDCTKCVGDVIQTLKFPTQKSPGDAWGLYSINFGG